MPGFAMSQSTGAYLEAVENAPEHVNLIPISGNNVVLGRDPKVSQISFNDRSVSRLHARILESHGSYRIYDEGSTSGTYVNYQRIGLTPRVLSNRDEVHVGRVHLRFHLVLPPGEQDDSVETARKTGKDDTLATGEDSGLSVS
jgi:predicted component of type VI protein secretion system